MAGLLMLSGLYGGALLAGFLSPYAFDTSNRQLNFHPPMLARVHVVGRDGKLQRPFVYGVRAGTTGRLVYTEDRSTVHPIRWLVRGDRYRILGPLTSDLHLFGVAAPGWFFPLGSDQLGRDLFSRILFGGRISLTVGLVGISISIPLGMLVGGIAGYFGGRTDFVLMRLVELIMSIPSLYLILTLRYSVGGFKGMSSTGLYLMIVAILAFIGWAGLSRVIRGMVLSLRERDYVVAARALGKSDLGIIVRHVLPNTLSFVIVTATLSIPGYILGEVALSFLGVGVQEPDASWGNMLRSAQEASNLAAYPWIVLPGFFIFFAVLAFNFLGDGLRDAADPRMLAKAAR
jgi:peptide/nickel transport system permease protein